MRIKRNLDHKIRYASGRNSNLPKKNIRDEKPIKI